MCLDRIGRFLSGVDLNYIRPEYGERVRAAGGSPLFLDYTIDPEVAAELCDGIVIAGGEDMDPSFYGEKAEYIDLPEPAKRTSWERLLVDACDRKGIPILGVCYGSQLLNVHYGGTLYQDIAAQTNSNQGHGTRTSPVVHDVTFERDFLHFKNGETVPVTARHHQAVKDMAPGMNVVARASDGTIEAITGYGHYGVQWHPESDDSARKIYDPFITTLKTGRTSQPRESLIKNLLQRKHFERTEGLWRTRR